MYTSLLFPYTLDFFVSRLYPGQVYTHPSSAPAIIILCWLILCIMYHFILVKLIAYWSRW